MGTFRTLLLFDPQSSPQGWSERMLPGEYAVHTSFQVADADSEELSVSGGPKCTVFTSLADAEEHATRQVQLHPALRCQIYTHEGFGNPPARELRGAEFRDKDGLSSGFRRWTGSLLFFGGLALILVDFASDFRLSWPATIGARALPVGLILLLTEVVLVWGTRRQAAIHNPSR